MVATANPVAKAMGQTSPTGTDTVATRQSNPANEKTAGFTLVELLVTLVLVTLLSAILIPILQPSPARTLRNAAGELSVTLRETRREAQNSQTRKRFVIDTEQPRYQTEQAPRWRTLPDGMTVELTTARSLLTGSGRGGIDFFPDGSSTGGRIVLGLQGQATQVDVEWLTGRIRLGEATP